MTYNFDPDRWYERERARLEVRLDHGELDGRGYEKALEDLDRRFEDMVERLDGSFALPTTA